MSWGYIGAAAITVIGGAISANQSNKKAGEAEDKASALYQGNLNRLTEFDREQQKLYGPIEKNLVQQASSDQPLYYGQMSGAINAGTNAGERNLDTALAARGMTGSGLQAGGLQGMEMGRQGNLASAFQTGLQMRTALGQSLLARYQPMLSQQLMSGATTQAANFNQQQQMLYGNAAAQGWGNVAKGLGSAFQAYGNMNQGSSDQTTTNANMPTDQLGPIQLHNANDYSPFGLQPGVAGNTVLPPGMTPEDYGSSFLSNRSGIGPNTMNNPQGLGGGLNMVGPNTLSQYTPNIGGASTTSVK